MKYLVVALFILGASCGGDDPETLCGVGDQYNVSGGDVCVYDKREAGQANTNCPSKVPLRADWGDLVTCSTTEIPSNFKAELENRYPGANVVIPTDELCFNAEDINVEGATVGNATSETVSIENCGATPFNVSLENDAVFSMNPNPASVQPGQTKEFTVTITITEEGTFETNILLANDDTSENISVSVSTDAGTGDCPEAVIVAQNDAGMMGTDITAAIGDDIIAATFDASQSVATEGATITQYVWKLESGPPGVDASISNTDGETTALNTWTVGSYVVSLDVIDSAGVPACEKAFAQVEVVFEGQLAVELRWRTPGDQNLNDDVGADLDLHLNHPDGMFADAVYDCFWDNPNPEWGAAGPDDNPTFVVSDRNGVGPETVLIATTEPIDYRVGVYYFTTGGYGASFATVRVFSEGTLVTEETEQMIDAADDFWLVGTYHGSDNTFTADNLIIDGFPNF